MATSQRAGSEGSALAALGALLDRSLAQIAEASADARSSNREAVEIVSDRWADHARSVVWAASSGSRRRRERRALAVLAALAGPLPARRDELRRDGAFRDYRGLVVPLFTAATPQAIDSLAADYELGTALVQSLLTERAGDELIGRLKLAVIRRFPVHDESRAIPATLDVFLRGITDLQFDSSDDQAAAFVAASDGVSLSIGERGTLKAARVEYWLRDEFWHLSAAGRRADAVTPPRDNKQRRPPSPHVLAFGRYGPMAGALLYEAMIEFRMARLHTRLPSVPPKPLLRAFDGTGAAILAAGAQRSPQRREAAYRQLIETWIERGGPDLADWFVRALRDRHLVGKPNAELLELAQRGQPSVPATDRSSDPTATGAIEECEPRLVQYVPARVEPDRFHDVSVFLHLAVPDQAAAPDTPWRMRLVRANPTRFQLQIGAFQQARAVTGLDADGSRHLSLGDDALLITGADGRPLD